MMKSRSDYRAAFVLDRKPPAATPHNSPRPVSSACVTATRTALPWHQGKAASISNVDSVAAVGTAVRHFLLLVQVGEDAFYLYFQSRQVFFDWIPHLIIDNGEVGVDKNVAHGHNLRPRDLRLSFGDFFREMGSSFSIKFCPVNTHKFSTYCSESTHKRGNALELILLDIKLWYTDCSLNFYNLSSVGSRLSHRNHPSIESHQPHPEDHIISQIAQAQVFSFCSYSRLCFRRTYPLLLR